MKESNDREKGSRISQKGNRGTIWKRFIRGTATILV